MSDEYVFQSVLFENRSHVFTVSELTILIKEVLENIFPSVAVIGEVADLSVARSGHCYLTLKDEGAQLPAVIWRSYRERLTFDLHDGLQVLCRGRLEVYPPHGRYQLIVEEIEPSGWGAKELALRRLKERLAREGLFDAARKRPLPRWPRRIGVITSPTGAAIHDFLTALRERFRAVDVLIIPVKVQGEGAAEEITQAFQWLEKYDWNLDVIVLTRGGGSIEDLWAFNEESVVRAVASSRIPVVSAVGHEIDVTLADLAADVRALTPTDAASKVVPSQEELEAVLAGYAMRLRAHLDLRLKAVRPHLDAMASRPVFRFPKDLVYTRSQEVDEWERRLEHAGDRFLERSRMVLTTMAARLESLSPLGVLSRGYSMTLTHPEGRVVREAASLSPGTMVQTRLHQGSFLSRVEEVHGDGEPVHPDQRI
ncbi:Exodeoxyribonuclease VII large subunit [Thermogutta terrifontis]|uniref:Exodeoxyribonuclease 7 large subunit n=1 Tax=Thermogutta terrifontis TaxID=1331910 RepID=A0A286RF75_9BACT|nr:Exodeoxyribonuclease VII large subunit [Thermogutta terrifontis]